MSSQVARLGRLWRTVRWLKAEQVTGRVRFRLQRPRPDLRTAPPLRQPGPAWVRPAQRQPSLITPTRFRLLSEEHDLNQVGWDDPMLAPLWRYNQHYFDDLNAADASDRRGWHRDVVRRWLDENPPGLGTGWDPYPTSLRIVNWIKWLRAGEPVTPRLLHSLAIQARWLTRRIEWHLLGNHLFANAKALAFAGMFFDGSEANAWLTEGLRIIERELPEQVLADGGHFERTPMYHALALEDLLDLLNLSASVAEIPRAVQPPMPELRARCAAMLYWLRCMHHADGTLARFNDCAEGIAPPMDEFERYAAALGIGAAQPAADGVVALQPSGYIRVARRPAVAWLDLAHIGPDYLPGHAHADTLSFELEVGGRELIVNRGTSVYGTGPRRHAERGTALHSTVQVGAHDSSEVWAGFRVGRRARPGAVAVDGWDVRGSHDGYAHLPNAPRHHRHWQFDADGVLVTDRLQPPAREPAVARFHLAPGLTLKPADDRSWRVRDGAADLALIQVIEGEARVARTLHAQRFGVTVDAVTLEVAMPSGRSAVRIKWGA